MASYFPKPLFGLVKSLTCLAGGVMAAYAMAPAYLWALMFCGFSAFYIVYVSTKTVHMTMIYTFCFALGYHVKGLWWIGNALLVEDNAYAWVWPISVIGLPTLLAIFPAIFAGISKRFFPQGLTQFIALVTLLGLAEWIRSYIFTGFPWNLYGYAWIFNPPILQSVSLFGPHVLTLLAIFWAMVPGFVLSSPKELHRVGSLLVATVTFLACWYYGAWRLENNPTQYHEDVQIVVVQPNIAQEDKWDADKVAAHFETLVELSYPLASEKPQTTFIVWPETAIHPAFLKDPGLFQKVLSKFPEGTYLLAGALRNEGAKYFNGLVVFNQKDKMPTYYDKSHLVPFGEYIPFQRFIPLKPVTEFNAFGAGHGRQTITVDKAPPFSPLICYEVIFPSAVVRRSPPRPEWIVNVTNDAWYGDSAGPHQHFAQSVSRAVEEGIPVVRSANTGISGIIDPYGRILAHKAFFMRSALQENLPKAASQTTAYSRYGHAFYFVLTLLLLASCVIKIRRT